MCIFCGMQCGEYQNLRLNLIKFINSNYWQAELKRIIYVSTNLIGSLRVYLR